MKLLGLNGGTIGSQRTSRRGAAPGIWTPNEQILYQRQNTWIGDASFDSVSLLLHMNGSNNSTVFTDSSINAVAVTANGNAKISTDQNKFDGASAYFNGASDSLTFNNIALGTGNFTIETWIKSNSSVQYAQIIGNETTSGGNYSGGFTFVINNNSSTGGQLALYIEFLVVSSSTGDWSDDTWHHIALTRSSNTFTIWGDGVSLGTGTSTRSMNSASSSMYLANNNVFASRNLVGYIDDLRITKGVARYTSNFTPPSAPFPDA